MTILPQQLGTSFGWGTAAVPACDSNTGWRGLQWRSASKWGPFPCLRQGPNSVSSQPNAKTAEPSNQSV